MSYWIPTVNCKNPDCLFGKPTFLPYPSQVVVSPNHPNWPEDGWKAFLVCQHCGHGYEYTAQDVRWGGNANPGLPPHNIFVCVEVKCAQKDCEFPLKIYMFVGEDVPKKTVHEKVLGGSSKASCQKGHTQAFPATVVKTTTVHRI